MSAATTSENITIMISSNIVIGINQNQFVVGSNP